MSSVELLAKLGATDVGGVLEQVKARHAELPESLCMAWNHQMRHPGKEGGCEMHPVEE